MSAIDFPASPVIGQIFITSDNAWTWDGVAWRIIKSSVTNNLSFGNIDLGDSTSTNDMFLNPTLDVVSDVANNLTGGLAGSIPYQTTQNQTAFSLPGTAGQALISSGAGAPIWAAAGLINVQVFTSSGTWTKTSGTTKIIAYVQGGGGGGAGAISGVMVYPPSGGGGGCAIRYLDVSSISSVSVTIGAGGNGGASGSGTAGGNTLFGAYATGNGGIQGAGTGGAGGSATGGTINLTGQYGSFSSFTGNPSAAGGSSALGFGGPTMHNNSFPGVLYGGGGSGNNNGLSGSAGAAGIVIVYEFS